MVQEISEEKQLSCDEVEIYLLGIDRPTLPCFDVQKLLIFCGLISHIF